MSERAEIVDGIAEMLWAHGWMDHVEAHGCENISGQNITDVMPPIPPKAHKYAEDWAKDVEKENGKSLNVLFEMAMAANKAARKNANVNPVAFGNALAMEMMGTGSGWFDDNAEFEMEVPDRSAGSDVYDLQSLAGTTCKQAWDNPACDECGAFNREDERKCRSCDLPLGKTKKKGRR